MLSLGIAPWESELSENESVHQRQEALTPESSDAMFPSNHYDDEIQIEASPPALAQPAIEEDETEDKDEDKDEDEEDEGTTESEEEARPKKEPMPTIRLTLPLPHQPPKTCVTISRLKLDCLQTSSLSRRSEAVQLYAAFLSWPKKPDTSYLPTWLLLLENRLFLKQSDSLSSHRGRHPPSAVAEEEFWSEMKDMTRTTPL